MLERAPRGRCGTSRASGDGARTSRRFATRAYTVTDADVEALKAAGLSEDEIFEQTVAAAIAEGLRRLDAAAAVIG